MAALGCVGGLRPHPTAVTMQDRGLAYLALGELERAEQSCRLAAEYDDRWAHPHDCLGIVAMRLGRPDEAKQHFKDALSRNSDFAEAYNNLGVVFTFQQDWDAACDAYLAALEIAPSYLDARENLAHCEYRRGRPGEARVQLIRLLELDWHRPEAHRLLGVMALEAEDYGEAENRLRKCLEMNDDPICRLNLGTLFLKMARFEDAIVALVPVARPGSGVEIEAREGLRTAYQQLALQNGALRTWLDKVRSAPGDPKVHLSLGDAFLERGFPEQAEREWRTAVTLDSETCAAYERLAALAFDQLRTEDLFAWCAHATACASRARKPRPRCADRVQQIDGTPSYFSSRPF